MNSKVIGLVDDEEVFHWLVESNVKMINDGCKFLSFFNGEEILNYLRSSPAVIPNILLLDLNMPVCSGWRFLENYANSAVKTEMDIYILSSSIDPEDKVRAKNFSIVREFVSKPISSDFLKRALNRFS
ncbi:Response regulator receiver domain-containing protein [Ekhidna lutea]|uniref:Response regulator receiver domain-containing protein n=1 Tax=Ekhidna lutea TaxID=447679 RepID=A0A239HZ37_EKHLU|nr:response regulator [Ekhidna lutea]SNS86746.1 Response regulator receiver domain-containing protein [Ekhidna lutea]